MLTFNLAREKWVPCILRDGSMTELSLSDVVSRSHELLTISDPSPLTTLALHRLVLVILHRNFGPADEYKWREMWEKGSFNSDVLDCYFNKWENRFDLFDENYPFYQSVVLKCDDYSKFTQPLSKMAHELSSGNNKTLFDHTVDDGSFNVTFGEMARRILTFQSFALGEGPSTAPKAEAPLADAAVFLVRGENVFQTLMLNMVDYNSEKPFPVDGDDLPVWERDDYETLVGDAGRNPNGYLDWLTWQSRRLLLITEGANISHVRIFRGGSLPKNSGSFYGYGYETMMNFGKAKTKNNVEYKAPIRFMPGKALWRDFYSLLELVKDDGPATLAWLGMLCDEGILPERVFPVDAFGFSKGQAASPVLWGKSSFLLSFNYIVNMDLVMRLQRVLRTTEEVGKLLSERTWIFIQNLLYEDNEPNKKTVSKVANGYTHSYYWSESEVAFGRLTIQLPSLSEEEKDAEEKRFMKEIKKIAIEDFNRVVQEAGDSVAAMRASAKVTRLFIWKVGEITGG